MQITSFPRVETLSTGNMLLVDGPQGTKTITMSNFPFAMLQMLPPENHRMIFRGKNLGSSPTATQLSSIANGTFADLWLGDYWVSGGINWRICDFDYWLYHGDSGTIVSHHVLIMPDTSLYDTPMHSSSSAGVGYGACAMRTSGLSGAKSTIRGIFGDHILTHRENLITETASNGYGTRIQWSDCDVEIPSESMIYGHFENAVTIRPDNLAATNGYSNAYTQLALTAVAPRFVLTTPRKRYWLRDKASDTYFCTIGASGSSYATEATSSDTGIRPIFGIKGN